MSTLLDTKAPSRYARSPVIGPVVDSDRPWPGRFPFKEEQRYYFFGRDDEIDELLHCVRRDTVTLLFSKSGLGKSSLSGRLCSPNYASAASFRCTYD